jgi:hypothetical protein
MQANGWGSVIDLVARVVGSNGGSNRGLSAWEGLVRDCHDQDLRRLGSLTVVAADALGSVRNLARTGTLTASWP